MNYQVKKQTCYLPFSSVRTKNIFPRPQKRPSAFGLGPLLRPRDNIFSVRTSQPVNNVYIIFGKFLVFPNSHYVYNHEFFWVLIFYFFFIFEFFPLFHNATLNIFFPFVKTKAVYKIYKCGIKTVLNSGYSAH